MSTLERAISIAEAGQPAVIRVTLERDESGEARVAMKVIEPEDFFMVLGDTSSEAGDIRDL